VKGSFLLPQLTLKIPQLSRFFNTAPEIIGIMKKIVRKEDSFYNSILYR